MGLLTQAAYATYLVAAYPQSLAWHLFAFASVAGWIFFVGKLWERELWRRRFLGSLLQYMSEDDLGVRLATDRESRFARMERFVEAHKTFLTVIIWPSSMLIITLAATLTR